MQVSPQKTSKVGRNIVFFLIAIIFLAIALFYSMIRSSPRMTVSKEPPIVFSTKGSNTIMFFQVSDKSGKIWMLYPNGNGLSLDRLSTVKYGEVPPSCHQAFPEDLSRPPPLIEGERYTAFIVIFDDPAINVKFTIKDGKPVDVVEEYPLKGKF